MPSVTVTLEIEEALLQWARRRAREQGTSVEALVRECLEQVAGISARAGVTGFLDVALRAHASSGPGGRAWSRDGLHPE